MVSVRVGENGADFGRLITCGSVWACPVCSARILYERTRDVARAVQAWEDRQGRFALVTLTVRHKRSDKLKEVWGLVRKAWSRVTSGKRWATVKDQLGMAGWLRTLEVTHGANGWHVHLHILMFLDADVTEDRANGAFGGLIERWTDAVESLGGSALNGVQDAKLLHNPTLETATYLTKNLYGGPDDLALELTRGDLKQAAGRTPFGILEDALEAGKQSADWGLWREYESASHRKRMHTWSQGFRDLLGLTDERSDEEIAADDDAESLGPEVQTVCWLPLESWRRIREHDGLYFGLLDAAARGGGIAFLDAHGLDWLPPEDGYKWFAGSVSAA
jgi:hypothetical protein